MANNAHARFSTFRAPRRTGPTTRRGVRIPIRPAVLPAPTSVGTDVLTWNERRLMLATLDEGLRTLLGTNRAAGPSWWRQEYAWLTSRDREQPFAFETICETFGLDADGIRKRVLSTIGLA